MLVVIAGLCVDELPIITTTSEIIWGACGLCLCVLLYLSVYHFSICDSPFVLSYLSKAFGQLKFSLRLLLERGAGCSFPLKDCSLEISIIQSVQSAGSAALERVVFVLGNLREC